MKNYAELLRKVLHEGHSVPDRTGTGTQELFGERLKFDLRDGFPLLTGKKTSFDIVKKELRWMLSGSTNTNDLDCGIWDQWGAEDGDLGLIYGFQWRMLEVDQIVRLMVGLEEDPHSRRHIVSAWNVDQLDKMALAPCHAFFQVNVSGGVVNLQMYQRSADLFIGVPYNISFYALLLELIAFELGLIAGELIITLGSAHIYDNHIEQVVEYLSRGRHPLGTLTVRESDICSASFDVLLEGYKCGAKIPAPVAV